MRRSCEILVLPTLFAFARVGFLTWCSIKSSILHISSSRSLWCISPFDNLIVLQQSPANVTCPLINQGGVKRLKLWARFKFTKYQRLYRGRGEVSSDKWDIASMHQLSESSISLVAEATWMIRVRYSIEEQQVNNKFSYRLRLEILPMLGVYPWNDQDSLYLAKPSFEQCPLGRSAPSADDHRCIC